LLFALERPKENTEEKRREDCSKRKRGREERGLEESEMSEPG
jgi:hypothetical protein